MSVKSGEVGRVFSLISGFQLCFICFLGFRRVLALATVATAQLQSHKNNRSREKEKKCILFLKTTKRSLKEKTASNMFNR